MSGVFIKLVSLSLASCPLILAVMAFRFLFKKAPRWLFCVLWAVVAVRLVFPGLPTTDFSLVPNKASSGEIVSQWSGEDKTDYILLDSEENYHEKLEQGYKPVPDYQGESYAVMKEDKSPVTIFAYIWALGVLSMSVYAAVSYIKLRHSVSASITLRENIKICDDIASPFILGVLRPKIYIPSSLSGETLDCILNHEKAHLKRLDYIWKPLGYLLLSVYWFNPLCWAGYILLCRDIEMACDEKVIKSLGSDEKARYSQALLDFSFPRKMIAACPVAFGETGVGARIKSVLNYKKPAFWVIIISVVVCTVVAVCFGTNPKNRSLPDGIFHAEGNDIMIPYIEISTADKSITLGQSGFMSYAENYTYKETRHGVEIYDSQGSKTDHTIKTQTDGVIFDGVGYTRPKEYLDEAVKRVLFEENGAMTPECLTEGHIVLDREIKHNTEKIYIVARMYGFNFVNGDFCAYDAPYALMVMEFKDGEYSRVNTSYPDEDEYENAVRNMFPKSCRNWALNLGEDDLDNMWYQCSEQAKDYLRSIGRSAVVTGRTAEKEIKISQLGISVESVERILLDSNPEWRGFCDFIGSEEYLENGRRFVYRTVHEKESKTLVFTKEDPLSGDEILLFRRIDIATGKDLGEKSYSLRTIYPEYYSLPTDKGLYIYVWKNRSGDYFFDLSTDHNKNYYLSEKLDFKGASLNDMREILSSYDISEKDITLEPINHPLSSYYWDYTKEFHKKEEAQVKGMLCAYLGKAAQASLSDEEYKYLTQEFFSPVKPDSAMARQFLTCTYDDVRYIDFYSLFYNGVHGNNSVSSEELELLGANDMCPVTKATVKDIEKVIKKYTGVSVEDTTKKNIGLLSYLSVYNAYYNQHGDTNCPEPVFKGGYTDSEGLICLLYDVDSYVVLRKTKGGDYYIVRNYNPDYVPDTSPETSSKGTLEDVSLALRTESYNSSSETYDRREWLKMSYWQKKLPNKSFDNKKIIIVGVYFIEDEADCLREFEVCLDEEKVENRAEVLGCIGLPVRSNELEYSSAEIALLCPMDMTEEWAERIISENLFIRYTEAQYNYYRKLFESDIDSDGEKEDIYFSYGPTSGIYTFVLSAKKKNSDVFYYGIFSPMDYDVSEEFIIKDGRPAYAVEDEDGSREYFYITVKGGNIALMRSDGEKIPSWGYGGNPILQSAFMTGAFDSDYFDAESRFGVYIYAENVTNEGLTLVFGQTEKYGDDRKTPEGEIITGDEYYLEVYSDQKWHRLPLKRETGFNDIGYIVPRGKEARLDVNWKSVYGELENSYKAGLYRISKKITLKENGRSTDKTIRAYFAVYDNTPYVVSSIHSTDFKDKSKLSYDLNGNGVKENIVLRSANVSEGYVFEIKADDKKSGTITNRFFSEYDCRNLEATKDGLFLTVKARGGDIRYAAKLMGSDILLSETRSGALLPFYGDQTISSDFNK